MILKSFLTVSARKNDVPQIYRLQKFVLNVNLTMSVPLVETG